MSLPYTYQTRIVLDFLFFLAFKGSFDNSGLPDEHHFIVAWGLVESIEC